MTGGYHPWSIFNAHRWSVLNAHQQAGFSFEVFLDGMIERGSIGMIVGPAKCRKSMLALNFVHAVTTCVQFLGLSTPTKPEKVLYVNLELTRLALGVRLRAMGVSPNFTRIAFAGVDDFIGDEILVDVKTGTVNRAPFRRLIEAAKKWAATVIVIDPLYYIVGEENDNVLMTLILRELGRMRDELGVTIIVVHHTKKERTDWSDPFQAGRGASSLGGFFEWVLGIEPVGENTARLHHGSRNLRTHEPLSIAFDDETLTWNAAGTKSLDAALDDFLSDNDEMIASIFVQTAVDAGIGTKKAIQQTLKTSKRLEYVQRSGRKPASIRRRFDLH
jgi:hypothetical protein